MAFSKRIYYYKKPFVPSVKKSTSNKHLYSNNLPTSNLIPLSTFCPPMFSCAGSILKVILHS